MAFYQLYFDLVKSEEPLSRDLGGEAHRLACRYGLAGVDALHIAAALRLGVQEFITSEKPEKPLFKVTEVSVVSLHSLL